MNTAALQAIPVRRLSAGPAVGQVTPPNASILVGALTETAVPEASADLLCLFRADAVLVCACYPPRNYSLGVLYVSIAPSAVIVLLPDAWTG